MSYRGRSTFFVIINRFFDSLKPKNAKSIDRQIGSDYLGNNYFETQTKQLFDAKPEPRRWFRPPNEELWDRPLPPEWNAWLRKSRKDPPTAQEIEYNLLVAQKKKEFDKESKVDKIEPKLNPFSNFPSYPEYEDSDRTKH